jgi:hypothetical protein
MSDHGLPKGYADWSFILTVTVLIVSQSYFKGTAGTADTVITAFLALHSAGEQVMQKCFL